MELKIFDEHFPQYAEIREHILDSEEALFETSEEGDTIDRARKFISASEYERLDPTKRNQLALERYISRNHSQQEIGRFYERYLGYLWETAGWEVQFKGLVDGFEDLGRDLICKKAGLRLEQGCGSVLANFEHSSARRATWTTLNDARPYGRGILPVNRS